MMVFAFKLTPHPPLLEKRGADMSDVCFFMLRLYLDPLLLCSFAPYHLPSLRMKINFNFIFFVRVIVAAILLQSLYFKFSASEESVYIFETVGMEPWGRIGSGVAELIAALLILIPKTSWVGALLALGIISGAIFFHLTKLGIEVMEDGGFLFMLACAVFLGSMYILWDAYNTYRKRTVSTPA